MKYLRLFRFLLYYELTANLGIFICKYLWRHFTAKMTFYSLVTGLSGLSIISMKCWLRLKQLPAFTNKMPLDMFLTLVFHILALFTRCKNTSAFKLDIREFTQRRFWATHVNRKWAFLSFNMPYRRYQICMLSVFTLIETICLKICSKYTNWWMFHEVQWVTWPLLLEHHTFYKEPLVVIFII